MNEVTPVQRGPTTLVCTVTGGRGWASTLHRDRLATIDQCHGLGLVEGTLNLVSGTPIYLNTGDAFFVHQNHLFWHARLNDRPVVVSRWRGCPLHVFEVLADTHLRSAMNLVDGSAVKLQLRRNSIDLRRSRSWKTRFAWQVLWKWRESWFYREDWYSRAVQTRAFDTFFWRTRQ